MPFTLGASASNVPHGVARRIACSVDVDTLESSRLSDVQLTPSRSLVAKKCRRQLARGYSQQAQHFAAYVALAQRHASFWPSCVRGYLQRFGNLIMYVAEARNASAFFSKSA
jgi:hypothetical protein